MFSKNFFLLSLIATFFIVGCQAPNAKEEPAATAPEFEDLEIVDEVEEALAEDEPNILDITSRHGSFTTFTKLIEAAEMDETLRNSVSVTLLAPTDEAFAKLPEGTLEKLLDPQHKEELVAILSNHVMPEVYRKQDLLDGEQAPTLSGYVLQISKDQDLKLSNAIVTTSDIDASNGVVHIVDQVIFAEK
jgi:uncharacterized surface protein with fasciclin (FAS1) repeats